MSRVTPGVRRAWKRRVLLLVAAALIWWMVRPPVVKRLMPGGIAVGRRGVVYFTDSQNRCVWRLAGGRLTRYAGRPWPCPPLPGRPDLSAAWEVKVKRLPKPRDGALARDVSFSDPWSVAVDDWDHLYIVDRGPRKVYRVDPAGRIVRVWQHPEGESRRIKGGHWSYPPQVYQVAASPDGGLFLSIYERGQVITVNADGRMGIAAGSRERGYRGDGGPALRALLNDHGGLAVDRDGNLHIADAGNCRVRKVDREGIITTVARWSPPSGVGGPENRTRREGPHRIAVDDACNLYMGSYARILKRDASGRVTMLFEGRGGSNGKLRLRGQLGLPTGMAVAPDGSLYIADLTFRSIRRLDPSGEMRTVVVGKHPPRTVVYCYVLWAGLTQRIASMLKEKTSLSAPHPVHR